MSDVQELLDKNGVIVGRYKFEDKTFRRKVRLSKHLYRMRDSWGIEKTTFDTLGELGCEHIRILDEESNRIFSISYKDFWGYAVIDRFGNDIAQYFCPRQHFKIEQKT